ncbi:MAG: hypothetical protein MZU95_04910 [Desulfomicrobium escambiense]|nr:hypothetical protein [Desulfomicrobium escambiense]
MLDAHAPFGRELLVASSPGASAGTRPGPVSGEGQVGVGVDEAGQADQSGGVDRRRPSSTRSTVAAELLLRSRRRRPRRSTPAIQAFSIRPTSLAGPPGAWDRPGGRSGAPGSRRRRRSA